MFLVKIIAISTGLATAFGTSKLPRVFGFVSFYPCEAVTFWIGTLNDRVVSGKNSLTKCLIVHFEIPRIGIFLDLTMAEGCKTARSPASDHIRRKSFLDITSTEREHFELETFMKTMSADDETVLVVIVRACSRQVGVDFSSYLGFAAMDTAKS